jgi:LysM repeat protein
MTPFARARLISGLGLLVVLPAVGLPRAGQAHSRTYVVQSNDSLSALAYRFHTSVQTLVRLNGIADPNRLLVGQVLTLPDYTTLRWTSTRSTYDGAGPSSGVPFTTRAAGFFSVQPEVATTPATSTTVASETGSTYVVQPGDTLSGLSVRFHVPLLSLTSANGLLLNGVLLVGQHLVIPTQAAPNLAVFSPQQTQWLVPAATPKPTAGSSSAGTLMPVATSLAPAMPDVSQATVATLLTSTAQAYGVDPALVKAVAWQESGWQMVIARDGGIGVMQLMPATAAWVGPSLLGRTINPYNVTDNISAGVALLASYIRQYGNNLQLVLAAYNEGPQNLAQGILPSTAQYVQDVLALRTQFAQQP